VLPVPSHVEIVLRSPASYRPAERVGVSYQSTSWVRMPMAMKKIVPAPSPDAYVLALTGWRHDTVKALRTGVTVSVKMEEVIKWGHIVYFSNGPVLLIRAEEHRVLFGFWRGQRLREIDARLKPGGKYEMATIELREGDTVSEAVIASLTSAAVALNETHGNPTKL
jgi:hypothetical protein